MAQLKHLTVLLLLLQINTNMWILCGKTPYMDRSLLQKNEEEMFSGTLKDGRNENSAAETADSEVISEKPAEYGDLLR